MEILPFINNSKVLQFELKEIHNERKKDKIKKKRNYVLTKLERKKILSKTDEKCHICGLSLLMSEMEADHVKSHSNKGTDSVENFLPACKTCNNYRWNYLPSEMQWILKMGVWARTEIENGTLIGVEIAKNFINHEIKREKRRKLPRKSKGLNT